LNFSPNKIDHSATKKGVVVVNNAISFPCRYLKAFIKHKNIIPNCIIPITKAIYCFFRLLNLINGKNNIKAKNNLKNTTNSLGKKDNWDFINPKDNEKQTVAIIKLNISLFYRKKENVFHNYLYKNLLLIAFLARRETPKSTIPVIAKKVFSPFVVSLTNEGV